MKRFLSLVILLLAVFSVTSYSQENIPGTQFTVSGLRIIARDTLRVGGVFVNNGTVSQSGKTVLGDTLRVNAPTDLNGTLDVLGTQSNTGKLVVTDTIRSTGNADFNGAITDVNGKLLVKDTVRVTGDVDLNGLLDVLGNQSNTGKLVVTDTIRSTGNADFNGAITDVNGKLLVKDTVRVTGDVDLNAHLSVLGTITGSAANRGTAAFTSAEVVKSVFVTGATSADLCYVTPLAPASTTAPVAGDFCNCIFKTDSLIVLRAAGTTSGLGFNWLRIK